MGDVTITKARLRTEGRVFGFCGGIALSVNALSILYYETRWIELVTTLHVTIGLTILFYFASVAGRSLIGFAVNRHPAARKREDR